VGRYSSDGVDIYVEPAAFCGVAARMLADGGRDAVPAMLTLLGQALRADVTLLEAGTVRAAIPNSRIRSASPAADLATGEPIDLPVRARGSVLAVLSIVPTPAGLFAAWTVSPGPLDTIADLLALTIAAGPALDAVTDVRAASRTWFDLDESDRAALAGALHDGLVQSLVAARYLLDLAAFSWPVDPQPWLAAVRESVEAALLDGRGLLNATQVRTRAGRGLRLALEDLCAASRIPVQLHAVGPAAPEELVLVAAGAGYRFVQAALADLMARGAGAAEVRLAYGPRGVSIDVAAVGEHPAPPDQPGAAMRRWATRIELIGGSALLQPASAHLRFGPADGEAAWSSVDARAGRTM
jgi:hypothetical protein